MNNSISVIIISKNEERVIEDTLRSVYGWATEIILFDSGSTDKTVDIAKKYTEKVYITDWPGYGKQKNRALDKATCDWVLSIDADEVVSERLKNFVLHELDNNIVGYKVPVKLLYFGKYVRSLLKRRPLILFQRKHGKFTDLDVHEHIIIKSGKIKKAKGYISHNSYESLYHQTLKLNEYANIWAKARNKNGLKLRTIFPAYIHSSFIFIKDYIFYGAFLDGWRGLLLSVVHANYTFNKYAFLRTLSI